MASRCVSCTLGHSPASAEILQLSFCMQIYAPPYSDPSVCWHHYQAVEKLREMQAQPGLRPDAVSYSCAIAAAQRGGESSLALALFDEMLAARLVPGGALFATLIAACERKGDWHRALQLFDTMKVGHPPVQCCILRAASVCIQRVHPCASRELHPCPRKRPL